MKTSFVDRCLLNPRWWVLLPLVLCVLAFNALLFIPWTMLRAMADGFDALANLISPFRAAPDWSSPLIKWAQAGVRGELRIQRDDPFDEL